MAKSYNEITGKSLERLAALSDGIFAVAMTLLVLEVRIPDGVDPHSDRELVATLIALGPKFGWYALSFVVLGIRWRELVADPRVDAVVIAERPKLAPHVDGMRSNVARALGIDPGQVSVKGKTNESVDSMGAGQSIAVHAVALIQRS